MPKDNGSTKMAFNTTLTVSVAASVVGAWADNDVAVINAQNLGVTYQSRLMTMVMAIDINPATNGVTVVGTESLNDITEEPTLNGIFTQVRSASFTSGGSADIDDLNPHLDYTTSTVSASLRNQSIGDPRGVAWQNDGSVAFVTGMGSNNVVVINQQGNRVDHFEVGQGPTGIVLDDDANRGYVLNKFSGSISVINLVNREQIQEVAFFDPTPAVIKNGRPFLYDTHLTSGLGQASCASCHVDARTDRLSWDLSDPNGSDITVPSASNSTGRNERPGHRLRREGAHAYPNPSGHYGPSAAPLAGRPERFF